MRDLPSGFPREKAKKPKKFGTMSVKATQRMEERKDVIRKTHVRSRQRCEAAHIAPGVRCSRRLHCDEKFTRGRSGGTSQYDEKLTQTLCAYCDHCKENEVWASEILGLYGEQGKNKHVPISEQDLERAVDLFTKCKSRLCF